MIFYTFIRHNNYMTKEKLKGLIRGSLEPVLDSLTDKVYEFYEQVIPNIPQGMTDEQLKEFLDPLFKSQTDAMINSFKHLDAADLAKQVKENQNGR